MGDADNRRPQLDVGIEALIEEMAPEALCDACLAFAFEVAFDDVHAAVPRVPASLTAPHAQEPVMLPLCAHAGAADQALTVNSSHYPVGAHWLALRCSAPSL